MAVFAHLYILVILILPAITWEGPTTHDFGEIASKKQVSHRFVYRNTGSDTLWIDNVRPSCGCTSPDWSEAGVPPDSLGEIRIVYDGRDEGYFYKTIKVYFRGVRKPERLAVEGEVK